MNFREYIIEQQGLDYYMEEEYHICMDEHLYLMESDHFEDYKKEIEDNE